MKLYYRGPYTKLYHGDCIRGLRQIDDESIDLIFADPPYFLSNGGITCKSGQMACVDKGEWDATRTLEEKFSYTISWLKECYRVLKSDGCIWVSGTYHNIYEIGACLELCNYKILNNITWQKTNPPPNLACRCFTHSTETIIWACKNLKNSRQCFNYTLMKEENGGKQMKDVWVGPTTPKREKLHGRHPTQKPLYLLERIIKSTSRPGDLVLDPFCGSSTTGVAALKNGRRFIGIDNSIDFIKLSKKRIKEVE